MKLKEIKIENFRGIKTLYLALDNLTVLIGENNTGKSTVLEALRLILKRGFGFRRDGQFAEYDFHLKDETAIPQTADPISIMIHFAEEKEDEWPEAIIQQMDKAFQLDDKGLHHIRLQTTGSFQEESGLFETRLDFINNEGDKLILKNTTPLNLISKLVPLFFLSAIRDASQEFGQRGQFWSGFMKSIKLPDDQREQIEEMLNEVNTSVINSNTGLTEVMKKIADAGRLVPLDSKEPVALEAIPTRVFDMVGKIQVHLRSNQGAKLPLQRHGEGTQSLAVLMLFQAFAATNLAEAYTPESTPLLALEEPEAHLHPSAIRSLGSFLENMAGQVIITSHSGDLVSRVPIMSLRRIYKQNGATEVGQVKSGTFTDRELQAIDYNIRLTKGHYLFSRCWLLVEGESDYHLMPLLFEVMGYSQDQISFSVLEISQVVDKGEPFMKLAKALGIQWFMMVDGDDAGNDYISRANNHLESGETSVDRAKKLTQNDIEHEFWYNGYKDFIENMVTGTRKSQINSESAGDENTKTKLMIKAAIKQSGGKPAFAQALINEVKQRGASNIPQTIQDIIKSVVHMAGGQ